MTRDSEPFSPVLGVQAIPWKDDIETTVAHSEGVGEVLVLSPDVFLHLIHCVVAFFPLFLPQTSVFYVRESSSTFQEIVNVAVRLLANVLSFSIPFYSFLKRAVVKNTFTVVFQPAY